MEHNSKPPQRSRVAKLFRDTKASSDWRAMLAEVGICFKIWAQGSSRLWPSHPQVNPHSVYGGTNSSMFGGLGTTRMAEVDIFNINDGFKNLKTVLRNEEKESRFYLWLTAYCSSWCSVNNHWTFFIADYREPFVYSSSNIFVTGLSFYYFFSWALSQKHWFLDQVSSFVCTRWFIIIKLILYDGKGFTRCR